MGQRYSSEGMGALTSLGHLQERSHLIQTQKLDPFLPPP